MKPSKVTKQEVSTRVELKLSDVRRSDPRETIRRGSRLISSRVGVIHHIGHGQYHAQDPATYAMGIVASDISRFSKITNTSKGGGGGEVLEAALAATIGEAAERYCMFFYDKQKMVLAPYREVEQDAVPVEALRLYSKAQVDALGAKARVKYFDEDSVIRWVWGYSLTERRPRLVPASLVYMNYEFSDDEAVLGRNASTGLAAGLTIEEAILTGLYEVIERDAFTLCWLRRRPGHRIFIDDADLQALLKQRFNSNHPKVSIRVHDITLDASVPSFFVVLQRPTEFGPAVCVGSATRLDPRQAVRKCLIEAGQAVPYFRFLLQQLKDWTPSPDFSDVTSFDHHCVFYLKRPDLVPKAFAFLDQTSPEVLLSSIPNRATGRILGDIERCIELLRTASLEVVVVEITTRDIEDAGLRVVRVMIPGMVPLHGTHKYPFIGAKRFAQFPNGADYAEEVNPFPHPFP